MNNLRALLMALLLAASTPLMALDIAGVSVPEQVRLAGMDQPLTLNGAGIRKKFFVKVYVAALYLTQRERQAEPILAQPAANRVLMHVVYSEVSKKKMDDAWDDGFAANLDKAQLQAMGPRLEQFKGMFRTLVEGDVVWLDHLPGEGTRVTINEQVQGTVPGDDFNAALLAVWLGEKPVTDSLKKALLGADN